MSIGSKAIRHVTEALDISPTDFERARSAIRGVRSCIEGGYPDGYPDSSSKPDVCLQGSMRLGTVVRPLKDSDDSGFDVDLVAQLDVDRNKTNAKSVKHQIGDVLKADGTYGPMLDQEGGRCWTIEYAEKNEVGFHIDVLPSVAESEANIDIIKDLLAKTDVPQALGQTSIAITHKVKESDSYEWKTSNPKGFSEWFESKNQVSRTVIAEERARILTASSGLYANESQIPDELVRTPLRRAVQFLKRHRDVRFNNAPNANHKPISVIITTLSAKLYQGDGDVADALRRIVNDLDKHYALMENQQTRASDLRLDKLSIFRKDNGEWVIPNPVNPGENFADKWHEDSNARAKAFFQWVHHLRDDVLGLLDGPYKEDELVERFDQALVKAEGFTLETRLSKKAALSSLLSDTETPDPYEKRGGRGYA